MHVHAGATCHLSTIKPPLNEEATKYQAYTKDQPDIATKLNINASTGALPSRRIN
jgi:hypothetical protein